MAAGGLLRQLTSQREQAAGVVAMVVAQDHVGDGGEIDPQVAGVLEHGFGTEAGVEQDPASIDVHQCREPPLSHALIGEHGREDGDL
jgi:hypothetical protein